MAPQMFDGAQIRQSFTSGSGLAGVATAQYKFVKLSADNTVVLCAATTDVPIGVLQEIPVSTGDPVEVCLVGTTNVQASGSLSAGNIIATNGSGQAQAAVSTQYPVGQVINVAGATSAGNLIQCVVNCIGPTVHA